MICSTADFLFSVAGLIGITLCIELCVWLYDEFHGGDDK